MADETIREEGYQENIEVDYVKENQAAVNLNLLLKGQTHPLYWITRNMYETIRNYCVDFVKNHPQYPSFVWKPKICDVGCGGGFGSYILSHEADFVWGIDINPESVRIAKGLYEKHKNGIYYSSQLTFDTIDIRSELREIQAFDVIACIEVIEHIADYNKVLSFLKKLCKKDKKGIWLEPPNATAVFISSPNRNSPKISKERPKNAKHVREWNAAEMYGILTKHFKYVTLMDIYGNPKDLDMQDQVMFFKCETPID